MHRIHILLYSPTVPIPYVELYTNHSGPFYIGTGLELICSVKLNPYVDSNESIIIAWSGPSEMIGERYSFTPVSGSGENYTSTLIISSLVEGEDSGQYTCNVTITGGSNILDATSNDDVFVNVLGNNNIIVPQYFV